MTLLTVLRTSAHDLSAIPDGTVHTVITSPPYYGLRSYSGDQDVEWPTVRYRLNEWCEPVTVKGCEPGCEHEWVTYEQKRGNGGEREYGSYDNGVGRGPAVKHPGHNYCLHCGGWRGPLGLEPSPVAYIGHLILCLREWRRVLRDEGTVWVNLGDSYATHGGSREYGSSDGDNGRGPAVGGNRYTGCLKPKDLLGIPWMFAFAARADGWYLRSDIIWAKGLSFLPDYAGSSMPESVRDRPSKGHEYIFLLAKSPKYYFDIDAVKEPVQQSSITRVSQNNGHPNWNGNRARSSTQNPQTLDINKAVDLSGRNLRSVWAINPQGYPGSHYAVFPPKLVEPMVKAATSERGCCPECGAPWRRVVERTTMEVRPGPSRAERSQNGQLWTQVNGTMVKPPSSTTIGWLPTCACPAADPIPCTVLDPFAGSGTTGVVAIGLGRAAILADISNEYLEQRTNGVQIGLAL